MSTDYAIRRAGAGDLDTLVDFATHEALETEGERPAREAVERGIAVGLEDSGPATYWVAAVADGSVVGSISVITEWSNFRGGHYWWVQSLYVRPEHRGTGLVDLLLDTVSHEAFRAGAIDLRLYVLQSNERAIAAYRRCGFVSLPYTIMKRDPGAERDETLD